MEIEIDITSKINRLKEKKEAILLAHNYQRPEIQDIADFVGDSLELSLMAQKTKAKMIVFCGVRFMAETAKILSPDKIVLLPEESAGCPLADMITPHQLQALKEQNPGVPVVCYINSSVEIKAMSDIACTSANAKQIVASLSSDQVIFIPDQGLGSWVAESSEKHIILHPGYCPTHYLLKTEDIINARKKYPGIPIIVHPECPKEIRDHSDYIAGTGGMIRLAKELPDQKFIIGTEEGMAYRLKKVVPTKEFILLSKRLYCPNMKKTTLSSVLNALENQTYEITVLEKYIEPVKKMLEKMFQVTHG